MGAFGGAGTQGGLGSIEEHVERFAGGLAFSDKRFVYVALLLYNANMGAPTKEDAAGWAKHFGMDRAKDRLVCVPAGDLRGDAAYNLIPGFQLIDGDFTLVADSTGHAPKDDLYRTLLPMLGLLCPKGK